jgi:hypothetical protein
MPREIESRHFPKVLLLWKLTMMMDSSISLSGYFAGLATSLAILPVGVAHLEETGHSLLETFASSSVI